MRKTQVVLIDDIDGTEADRTVTFGLEGENYEIELSDANFDKLGEALAPYIAAARKVAGGRGRGRARAGAPAAGGRPKASDVREWAKANNIDVPERGRIPNAILEQYEAAN